MLDRGERPQSDGHNQLVGFESHRADDGGLELPEAVEFGRGAHGNFLHETDIDTRIVTGEPVRVAHPTR